MCKNRMSHNAAVTVGFFVMAIAFSVFPLDPKLPPGRNFDLSIFKLQTMSLSDLSFIEIKSDTLSHGFTSKFFYTDTTDGSMVFMTPANGGTTSGSSYPRTELRQTGAFANWKLTDTTTYMMKAVCKVTKAPYTVVIGQVHGSNDNSEMVELEWMGSSSGNCKVSAMFQTNNSAGSNYFVDLATGLSLGSQVTYEFKMKAGVLTVTVNGKSGTQTYTTQYYGSSDGYYFKAGNYLQGSSSSSSTYSETKFYSIQLFRSGDELVHTLGNETPRAEMPLHGLSLVKESSSNGSVFTALGKYVGRLTCSGFLPTNASQKGSAGLFFVRTANSTGAIIRIK